MPGGSAPGTVKVTGAAELRRAMKRMGHDLKDLTNLHREAAKPVLDEARSLVPTVSGTLSRSIRISASKSGASIRAGRRSVPYAGPIHFGWPRRNIESQPFLFDAIANKRDEVLDIYGRRVDELVKRLDKETP